MGSSLEFLLDSIFFFELVPKSTYYALMLAQTFLLRFPFSLSLYQLSVWTVDITFLTSVCP